jgi:diguanylate cyclase (GGDEF)-like protein
LNAEGRKTRHLGRHALSAASIGCWLRKPVVLAALIVGVSCGSGVWAIESGVYGRERTDGLSDVRDVLGHVRDLLAMREGNAAAAASRLGASAKVQDAFARHDVGTLARIASKMPGVGFTLGNGRAVGRMTSPSLEESVAVYSRGTLAGHVVVSAGPDAALLQRARTYAPATHLAYTIGGRLVLASPPAGVKPLSQLLDATVNDRMTLNIGATPPAQLIGFRTKPSIMLGGLWPWLAGIVAGLVSIPFFARREAHRPAVAPQSIVRDAVNLVGKALAATHDSDALLPVILQTAVDATQAVGGTITISGEPIFSRGEVVQRETLDLPFELPGVPGETATLTLYPPSHGFDPEARDAAAWIASQAVIALENVRLHGLVQRQAVTDDLTGLANRRSFLTQLGNEVARSRQTGTPLAIVLADLDDFKRVNDNFGHDVGDRALVIFADILRSTVRDVDLPVRLGGEEFAVLLPDTDLQGAVQLAERVREALAEAPSAMLGGEIRLTASFGVSCFPTTASEHLLAEADGRLYEAKRRGKNRVVAYDGAVMRSRRPIDV